MHSFSCALQTPYQAVVIVPVADLAGQSLQEKSKEPVTSIYKKLSICGKKGEFACPRVHQALFHEFVTVLEERNQEVLVKINNFFFETEKDSTRFDTFWSLKKNFMPLAHLEKHNVNLALLPEPVMVNQTPRHQQKITTLLYPYRDTVNGLTYSAGTRFVQAPLENHERVTAYALNPRNTYVHKIEFPKNLVSSTENLTLAQRKKLFVRLCRMWAHEQKGLIPYVWGGCSLTAFYPQKDFTTHEDNDHHGNPITYFKRSDVRHPHSGFDCAGLIARAAQTAGLPYYFKNSTTLAKHLPLHTKNSPLQAGDVIWFPGHVMVMGNIEKNTVIEARHYSHGYGKVHEIPLAEAFKDISTYEQLKQAFLENKPLLRLDKDKNVIQKINNFKLLEMKVG